MAAGELLEDRQLLAADLSYDEVGELWAAALGTEPIATPLTNVVAEPMAGTANPSGFYARPDSHAYGFDQIYFHGDTIVGDGTGQTIAIVNAYHTPNAASDLAAFNALLRSAQRRRASCRSIRTAAPTTRLPSAAGRSKRRSTCNGPTPSRPARTSCWSKPTLRTSAT